MNRIESNSSILRVTRTRRCGAVPKLATCKLRVRACTYDTTCRLPCIVVVSTYRIVSYRIVSNPSATPIKAIRATNGRAEAVDEQRKYGQRVVLPRHDTTRHDTTPHHTQLHHASIVHQTETNTTQPGKIPSWLGWVGLGWVGYFFPCAGERIRRHKASLVFAVVVLFGAVRNRMERCTNGRTVPTVRAMYAMQQPPMQERTNERFQNDD